MKKIFFVATLTICLTVACQKNEDSRNGREIKFPTYEKTTVDFLDTIPVTVPANFTKSDFAAFSVTVESGFGSSTSVTTKSSADSKAWEIETLAPVFDGEGKMTGNPGVVVKRIPMDGSDAVLTASLVSSNGERMNTSVVVSSADYSDLEGKWEACADEITNLEEGKIIELICWYMYFLYDADGKEEFSEDILEFVNTHKRLFLASKYTDLQDEGIAGDVNFWKNLSENQEDEKTPETTNGVIPLLNPLHLDDRTLLCHTTLPCASHTLSFFLSVGDEIKSLNLPEFVNEIIVRLCTFQQTFVEDMFSEGVRVFDFQLIKGLGGNSLLCHSKRGFESNLTAIADLVKAYPSEFAIVIVSASIKQTIKDLLDILRDGGNESQKNDTGELLNEIHKFVADFMAKPENKDLFVPFRANMTVRDARGHIIIMWGDEWEDDTTVEPFGAVINKPYGDDIMGSIQIWNSDTEEWEDEADLMYNDIRFRGDCFSNAARESEAQRVAYNMRDFDQQYRSKIVKLHPVPLWCIHRADCVMNVEMPFFPKIYLKIFKGITIESYPNVAWTAAFVNKYVDYYFSRIDYQADQRGPSGIVYLHMAAAKQCAPPLFGHWTDCYGVDAVHAAAGNQPIMPYLQPLP